VGNRPRRRPRVRPQQWEIFYDVFL